MPYSLCVLGCGTMGIAVLSGVLDNLASPSSLPLASGSSTPSSSLIIDPQADSMPNRFIACVNREESVRRLNKLWRDQPTVEARCGDNPQAVAECDVVLLCCKPQLAQSILLENGMAEALDGKLIISILAGMTIAALRAWVPASTRVVRAMPNTPCKIREGMTLVSTISPREPYAHLTREILSNLFTPIGRCRFLDEKHFDACTALAGSGPAFVCLVLEAMTDGGVMMGLPRAEALELAAQTMQGAARMVLQTGMHPAAVKDSVTTPGGCTIAGLLTLEDGKVRSTMARCIQAATEHARGLGGGTSAVNGMYQR